MKRRYFIEVHVPWILSNGPVFEEENDEEPLECCMCRTDDQLTVKNGIGVFK
jgi:hypothetical protein